MSLPSKTSSLPFRWSDFSFGKSGKCFPACVVMCNKYWNHYVPDLNLPLDIIELEETLGDTFYSKRGLNLEKLNRALGIKDLNEIDGERLNIGLTVEARTPRGLDVLYPFFQETPPIPLILLYDHNYMESNRQGNAHAVILHSIDYGKEKLYVIDPIKKDLRAPFPYDFNRFSLGWKKIENLTLIVAPLDKLTVLEGKQVARWEQKTLKEMVI